jgi:site-specific DNA-methyltransferase (adenine-specific)
MSEPPLPPDRKYLPEQEDELPMREAHADGGWRVLRGDALEEIGKLDLPGSVIVLTDPPYDERTHKNALSGNRGENKLVTFASVDLAYVRNVFEAMARRFKLRWVIATMAYQHAFELEREPPPGLEFIRMGCWTKPNATPQFTGDRPAQGWEAIAILHPPGRKRWNGGGLPAVWNVNAVQSGRYPTEKPEALYAKILAQFAEPGDTVLDPFCGSGTSLRVAKDRGLQAIGIDISEEACRIADQRLRQSVLFT